MSEWKDGVYTQGELYDMVDELRAEVERLKAERNEARQAAEKMRTLGSSKPINLIIFPWEKRDEL